MSVTNLDSGSGSSLNASSEVTVRTYTTAADGWVSGRLLLSSLNGAAATITVKVQLLDASDNKLGVPVSFSFAKDAAADTTAAANWGPVRVLSGQKLRVRVASTNSSDSSIAWTSLMDDALAASEVIGNVGGNVAGSVGSLTVNNDKTGYGLADGAITADKIAASAITAAKIEDSAITNAKLATGAITAATIAASALNGKGDWNIGKTGYTLTQAFPSNFASLGINASGHVSRVTLVDTATTLTSLFTFTGARAVTITVTDDDDPAVALSGALVRVTQSGDSELKQTNGSGVVTFSLDDGAYTLSITNGAAYSYTPETITVSAVATSFTKEMTTNSITTPSAGQCTGTLLCVDPTGAPESNVTVYFRAVGTATDGYAYDSTVTTSTSNGSGVVSRLFPSGSVPYEYRRGTTGNWVRFTTAADASDSFDIPSSVGKP